MLTKGSIHISGEPVLKGTDNSPVSWILFLLPLLLYSVSLAVIYFAMRGVMDLGGFVASGGPYEIAHPAPNWVWLFPVFMNLMVFSMIGTAFIKKKIGGPNLMSLSWSALFISLGWNFAEYGFAAEKQGGPVIAWIICAILFILMGGIPLIFLVKRFVEELGKRDELTEVIPWKVTITIQLLVAAVGLYLGTALFQAVN